MQRGMALYDGLGRGAPFGDHPVSYRKRKTMTVLDSDSLAKRIDDDGSPAVIIAEAGSNHDGSLDRARELVDAAAYAGATR